MTEIKIRRENSSADLNAHSQIDKTMPYDKLSNFSTLFNKRSLPPLTYFLLGTFLFGSLGIIFNVYVIHLKIETSVVSVPIETMMSPAAGFIKEVLVTPGTQVKKGDLLMKIENIDVERDKQLARVEVEDSKLTIAYLQKLLANEQNKLNVYKTIGSNRVASTQAIVDMSQQEVLTSKNNLSRMRFLLKKHYVTPANWDEALTKYKSAEEKMKSATAQRNIESNSLSATDNGLYFTGQKLEGLVGELTAQIEAAQKRLLLNQERVTIYEEMLRKLTLAAPFDGKVTEVLKSVGNTTDSVKPVLILAQTQAKKTIIAYLTQDEITHVSVAGKVKFYIPSVGKSYHGRIMSIDRTAGFVDAINAQYRWRDLQIDRSATVIIEIAKQDEKNFNRNVLAGMPAIVYFSRKFTFL
jgi:multidrug resistance efflux pump